MSCWLLLGTRPGLACIRPRGVSGRVTNVACTRPRPGLHKAKRGQWEGNTHGLHKAKDWPA